MSVVLVRAALEEAIRAMVPALSTAWENTSFTSVNGVPYQEVHLLFARPSNQEYGSRHQEQGYLQVTLKYPQSSGVSGVGARAEMLRTTFARGRTFQSGGVTTMVTGTPEVSPGRHEGNRFVVTVKIPFLANIN